MARGSIVKRKSQRTGRVSYQVRVELPPDPKTGNRRQGAETYRTLEEAQRRLKQWTFEIERGSVVLPDKLTVGELLALWLESTDLRPTSRQSYQDIIDRYLLPGLGSVAAQKLRPPQVQSFMADLRRRGVGVRTQQLCLMRLRQALDYAVQMELVSRNVAKTVSMPRSARREPTIWTPEDAQRFLAAAGDWEPLFAFFLATGLRRGEALALRWRDVDWRTGTIDVRRTVSAIKGQGLVVAEPKTERSKRKVRLGKETLALLQEQRVELLRRRMKLGPAWEGPRDTENSWIFPNEFGGLLYPANVQRAFSRIIRESGVPKIRIHDMRHTHATWLLLAREPVQVVSERLGHAKASITLDLYAHTLADSQESAADITDRLLREKREVSS